MEETNAIPCLHFERRLAQSGQTVHWQPIKSGRGRRLLRGTLQPDGERIFMKSYSAEKKRRAFRDLPEAVLAFFPLRHFACEACGLVVEAEAPGLPLDRVAAAQRGAALRRAGKALGRFHAATRESIREIRSGKFVRRIVELSVWIRERGEPLAALPHEPELRTILSRRLPRRLPETWIHGDLKPEHIFIQGERVTFVDPDAVRRGIAPIDAANMMNHLAWSGVEPHEAEVFIEAYQAEFCGFEPAAYQAARLYCCLRTIRNRMDEYGEQAGRRIALPLQMLNEIGLELNLVF